MPLGKNIINLEVDFIDKYKSIQKIQNLSTQNINTKKTVKLVIKYLKDIDSFISSWHNLQEELDVIKLRLIELEYTNDGLALEDAKQSKEIPEQIKKFATVIVSSLEVGFKCAEFLVMNNDNKKLMELFNITTSKIFKDKVSFQLAEYFIKKGNIHGIKMLNAIHNILDISNKEIQNNLFHIAIENNQIEILKLLFASLFNKEVLNEKNQLRESLLESAFKYSAKQFIENGCYDNDIVIFLINNLDINSLTMINLDKRNYLHIAAILGNIDIMKLLIVKLKDFQLINTLDNIARPLQTAICAASIDKTGVPKSQLGWIGYFYYFKQLLVGHTRHNHIIIESGIVKILIKNYEEIVKLLLSNLTYEQINAKDNEGDTPVHECVYRSNVEMLKLVLAAKGNINAQNNDLNTPLHGAVKISSLPIIKLLLARQDIDLTIKNNEKFTACELISKVDRTNKKEIAELFIQTFLDKGIKPPEFLYDISDTTVDENNGIISSIPREGFYEIRLENLSGANSISSSSDSDNFIAPPSF